MVKFSLGVGSCSLEGCGASGMEACENGGYCRFGNLDNASNRKSLMKVWLKSKGFRRSGLQADALTKKVVEDLGNVLKFVYT